MESPELVGISKKISGIKEQIAKNSHLALSNLLKEDNLRDLLTHDDSVIQDVIWTMITGIHKGANRRYLSNLPGTLEGILKERGDREFITKSHIEEVQKRTNSRYPHVQACALKCKDVLERPV